MNFNIIFDRVIGHEAGFTDDPRDNGNWTGGKVGKGVLRGTKWGIAANTYPHLVIKSLTKDQARSIYYEDWFVELKLYRFTSAMQYQMFDAAFNHGMKNASKIFQRAVGAHDDGIIGQKTLEASTQLDEADILLKFNAERIKFYTSLSTFKTFGKGWMNRVAQNLIYASQDN